MVNTEEFIKRLEIILDYYGLNASAFADKLCSALKFVSPSIRQKQTQLLFLRFLMFFLT
jgi:hypothetical protein